MAVRTITHWMKYVRWDVVARWRRVTSMVEGERRYPFAFGSRDKALKKIAGGVLWLVSSPRYGQYRQAPSLIARLDVTDVVPSDDPRAKDVDPEVRRWPWIALAEEKTSVYLPLNNVFYTLQQLRFEGTPDRLPDESRRDRAKVSAGAGPYSDLPGHFRRHRVLTPASADILKHYAEAVSRGRRVFLSYHRQDFDQDKAWLRELADTLAAHNVSCWWDRWHMPGEGNQQLEYHLLEDILDDAIHQSAWFVALMRSGYLAPDPTSPGPRWARREWEEAGHEYTRHRRHQMHRVAIVFDDQSTEGAWTQETRLEQLIPSFFAVAYTAGFLSLLFG